MSCRRVCLDLGTNDVPFLPFCPPLLRQACRKTLEQHNKSPWYTLKPENQNKPTGCTSHKRRKPLVSCLLESTAWDLGQEPGYTLAGSQSHSRQSARVQRPLPVTVILRNQERIPFLLEDSVWSPSHFGK